MNAIFVVRQWPFFHDGMNGYWHAKQKLSKPQLYKDHRPICLRSQLGRACSAVNIFTKPRLQRKWVSASVVPHHRSALPRALGAPLRLVLPCPLCPPDPRGLAPEPVGNISVIGLLKALKPREAPKAPITLGRPHPPSVHLAPPIQFGPGISTPAT